MSETYVKWDNLISSAENISACTTALNQKREDILSVGKNLPMSENISQAIKAKINSDAVSIEELIGRIDKISSVLESVANIYKSTEENYK